MEGNMVQTDWSQDYFYYLLNKNEKNVLSQERLNQIKDDYQKKAAYLDRQSLYGGNGVNSLKDIIQKKIEQCEAQEAAFFEGCNRENGISSPINYKDVTDKVRFCTNYFYYGIMSDKILSPSQKIANLSKEFCFKTLISSADFLILLRSKERTNEVSRTGYAGKKLTGKEKIKFENEITSQLKSFDLSEFQKEIVDSFKASVKDDFKEKVEMDFLGENGLFNRLAKEYAKLGYDKLQKQFRNEAYKLFEEYATGQNGQTMLTDEVLNSRQIKIMHKIDGSNPTKPAVVLTLKDYGIFSQVRASNPDLYQDIIKLTIDAIKETIRQLKGRKTLDLMWGGELEISEEVLNIFYENALSYAEDNKVKQYITNILYNKSNIDDVSGITGVAGELAGAMNFQSIQSMQNTGAISDEAIDFAGKKVNLGESFADIMTDYGGVNIKHYLSSKTVITLYQPKMGKGWYNILDTPIIRYIPLNQLATLRFLDVNYEYVKQFCGIDYSNNDLITKYKNVALLNIDTFIRQSSVIENSNDVAFYQLNNLIIPSSAIFKMLKNQNAQFFKKMFDVKIHHVQYDMYNIENLSSSQSIDKLNQSHLLQNFYSNDLGSTIRFNGLQIKLRDFNTMLKG